MMEIYLAVPKGAIIDLVPALFELGYAVRLGTPEETMHPMAIDMMRSELPGPHEEVLALGEADPIDVTDGVARLRWAKPLQEAGISFRSLTSFSAVGQRVISGQLRSKDGEEPVVGRVHLRVDEHGHVLDEWERMCRALGIDVDRVHFDPDPDLPDH